MHQNIFGIFRLTKDSPPTLFVNLPLCFIFVNSVQLYFNGVFSLNKKKSISLLTSKSNHRFWQKKHGLHHDAKYEKNNFYTRNSTQKNVSKVFKLLRRKYKIKVLKSKDFRTFMVRVSRFELEASWTPFKRDTKLRHTRLFADHLSAQVY